jgi:CPA2 family monovalent cation:H+ antiporter-2
MLLDLGFLVAQVPLILVTVVAVVALKFVAAGLPALLAGYPLRIAVLTGVTLAQIGEFSFILAERGLALGLLERFHYQTFLAAAVLTVALTPLLIALGPRLADWLALLPLPAHWRAGREAAELSEKPVELRNHVIIVGYGINGRNLARVLRAADIDYGVLELNPETVRQARLQDEPIYYGDSTRAAVLEHLGIRTARVLVVAISDPASSRRTVQLARTMNKSLYLIARTRYLAEVSELRMLGANAIIPEEFETSVEIFARVLGEYEVPRNLILELIERVRGDHYQVLRDVKSHAMRVVLPYANILEKMEMKSCWLPDSSPARGRTVGELNLRAATGATLLAVRRGREMLLNPGPDLRFEAGDTAILIGDHPQVDRAIGLLDPEYGARSDGNAAAQ